MNKIFTLSFTVQHKNLDKVTQAANSLGGTVVKRSYLETLMADLLTMEIQTDSDLFTLAVMNFGQLDSRTRILKYIREYHEKVCCQQ